MVFDGESTSFWFQQWPRQGSSALDRPWYSSWSCGIWIQSRHHSFSPNVQPKYHNTKCSMIRIVDQHSHVQVKTPYLVIVTRVNQPSVSLLNDSWSKVLVTVPPVWWTGSWTASTQDALSSMIVLRAVELQVILLYITYIIIIIIIMVSIRLGRWWISPWFSLSFLFSFPPVVDFSFLLLVWLPLSLQVSRHCDRPQAIPRCLGQCLSVSGRACRRPWTARLDDLFVGVRRPVLHTWCPLGYDRPPYGAHAQASANDADRAWDAYWQSQLSPALRCWWPCPAMWCWAFVGGFEHGNFHRTKHNKILI